MPLIKTMDSPWQFPKEGDPPRACTFPRGIGHRQDGLLCPDCGKWVCAWHSWCGDDDKQYCPTCSPRHRADRLPRLSGAT